jgi:hypothetical protein
VKLLRDEATTLDAPTFDLGDAELDAFDPPARNDRGGARRMIGRFTAGATAAAVGGLAIAAVVFLRLAFEWPAEEPRTIHGRQVLETTGRVTAVDWTSVVLAPTRLGFNGRRFVLDPQTRVLVGDREGAIGDVRVGATVAVIYERQPHGFVARWLGLDVDRDALHATATRSDVTEGDKASADKASPPPSPEPPKADARVEPVRPSPPPRSDAARPSPPPPADAAPTPSAARSNDDPGAVIDWLLSGTKRR